MAEIFIPPVELWEVSKIDSPEFNPNHMSADDFDSLCRLIEAEGFLQPLLVRLNKKGDRVTVTDGDHRHRAAQKLGMSKLPCVVMPKNYSKAKAALLQIAMNNIRGSQDLSEVAKSLKSIISSGEIDPTLSGFKMPQIEDMINSSDGTDSLEDLLEIGAKSGSAGGRREPEKLYSLEIDCGDAKTLKAVKKKLREQGDGDMLAGLLTALEV